MQLRSLKRHWERLGGSDPYWAVLTDPSKREGRWNPEEFFRAGVEEVAMVLQRAADHGVTVPRRRALDFGCGVGRVTQALAAEFDRADGVDISRTMLDAARRHNRAPERCTYHLNPTPDLRLFESGAFTLVFSTLVLQHMEPRYSTRYMLELLRVLADDGLLVFQIPGHRTADEPAGSGPQTRVAGRLPASACVAHLEAQATELAMRAGEERAFAVTVENRSPHAWPSLGDDGGDFRINLANRWLFTDGEVLHRDDARCPLPHDLAPGQRAALMLGIHAPAFDGEYVLDVDLVQENSRWFAQAGSPTLRIRCQVTGGQPAPPRAPRIEPVAGDEEPPFRERYPVLFPIARALRLRRLYWGWRHGVDDVKRVRDRAILAGRARFYEPTVPRLINWWRSRPFAAKMEMYCVPRAEVTALVESNGGRIVHVEDELMPGGYRSYRYWVVKR